MKKISTLGFFFLVALFANAQSNRSNCPVFPITNTQILPDGQTITLTGVGNEMVNYLETNEGYTVLKNANNFFEYATNDINGNLVPTGVLAADGQLVQQKNLKLHARYSSSQLMDIQNEFNLKNQVFGKKAGGKPFPSKGTRKVLTLLIQYPDLMATLPKANFDSLMVKPNYTGTGSFRDYYLKTSYGQLELNGDVFGWYTADSGYLYYAKSNANYMTNVGKLVRKAVQAADAAGVNFKDYDNDNDGYVDGIIIMHAGIGAEESSAPSSTNYIWSHRYNLAYTGGAVSVDGVLVDAYGCFPEKRYYGGSYSQVGIGVITHEFGHLLDLPDLYATNQNSEGSGNFANMAGGPWLNSERTPCLHDAWTRIQLGWLNPTVINGTNSYTIPKSLADSNFCFRINTSLANEYFLLENRQKKGFDAYLPGKGLAVWHINTSKAKLLSQSSGNNVNNDTSSYGVGLVQADGLRHLEKGTNRGDAGDLYPGSTNNRSLTPTSNPNSSLYGKIGGIRISSNISINNITQNADSSITFTVGNKPSAGFDANPLSGCAPLTVNLNNTSAFSSNYLWKLEDGSTSKTLNVNRNFNQSGNYPITLYVLDSFNNAIDSVTQTISVFSSPKASFTLERGDSNSFNLSSKAKDALYVVWRFGSNQSSTSTDLTYKLLTPGKLPFMLIAYNTNQCTDTAFGVLDFWPVGISEQGALSHLNYYPNPFSSILNLDLELNTQDNLTLSVYNLLGEKLEELENNKFDKGTHEFHFDLLSYKSGVYLLEVKGSHFNKILRIARY